MALHCQGCLGRIGKTVLKTKGVKEMAIDKEKETMAVKGTLGVKALVENLIERSRKEPSLNQGKLNRQMKTSISKFNRVADDALWCRSLRHAHTGQNAVMGGGASSTGDVANNSPDQLRGPAVDWFCQRRVAAAEDGEGTPSFLWMGKETLQVVSGVRMKEALGLTSEYPVAPSQFHYCTHTFNCASTVITLSGLSETNAALEFAVNSLLSVKNGNMNSPRLSEGTRACDWRVCYTRCYWG